MNMPDFDQMAEELAINEACAYWRIPPVSCVLDSPCPECKALAKAIRGRLLEVYMAGLAAAGGPIPTSDEVVEALEVEDEG